MVTTMTTNTLDRNRGMSIYPESAFNICGGTRDRISDADALKIVDFTVEKEQSCRPDGTPVPHQFHLVRKDFKSDPGIIIGAHGVGDQFTATQPRDAVKFILKDIMPQVPGMHLETVAVHRDGSDTFANFAIGDSYSIKGDTSENKTRLLYVNPLTLGSIKLLSHTIRVVCENTLAMAQNTGTGFSIYHSTNCQFYVDAALKSIEQELVAMQEMKEITFKLADCRITSKNIKNILDKIYPIKKNKKGELAGRNLNMQNQVMTQFESDSTFKVKNAWAFLNAMTYGVEHPQKFTATRTPISVGFDNLVGGRRLTKSKMLDATMKELGLVAA